jgi:hypothetical protein
MAGDFGRGYNDVRLFPCCEVLPVLSGRDTLCVGGALPSIKIPAGAISGQNISCTILNMRDTC